MPKGTKVGRATRTSLVGEAGKTDSAKEGAAALRILLDDEMMRSIARIGRYRVLASETVVAQPADPRAGHRLAWINLVDYERDRSVKACVDLDRGDVTSLRCAPGEHRLAPSEEAEALDVALADRRVAGKLSLGDLPQAILHVGTGGDEAHRTAAVLFGSPRSSPSLVAVVDLARSVVTRVVPAERW